ncbi:hypothetical protein, partial [Pseudoflavonifractor capillosus]
GDMCLEHDTSHEIFADNFIRNRGENFMKLLRKSGGSHFFESLRRFRSRGNAAQRVQKTSVEQNCLRRDRGARRDAAARLAWN